MIELLVFRPKTKLKDCEDEQLLSIDNYGLVCYLCGLTCCNSMT